MENRRDTHSPQRRINRNEMTKKIHDRMNQESCLIMDNDEFFMETYKPFDEYLKKHKYDPKTNTIEIDGKREPIKTKMSNKEMNRLNKFLRENKYDPKTETILTDVDSGTSDAKKRVKFTMNSFSQDTKGAHYNLSGEINIPIKNIAGKPSSSNQVFKHEEGHFNDFTKGFDIIDAKHEIAKLEIDLKYGKAFGKSEVELKKLKDQLAIAKRRYQKLQMQKDHIEDIQKKAKEFNENQDYEGFVKKRRGDYNFDHDITPFENYADYYGTKHNKYGDKTKNVAGNLFNDCETHKKKDWIDKWSETDQFSGDDALAVYHSIRDIFKKSFSYPDDAMENAGVFKALGIDSDDIGGYELMYSNNRKKLKELRNKETQLKEDLKKEFPRYAEYTNIKDKIKNAKSFEERSKLELDPKWMDLQFELDDFIEEHPSYKKNEDDMKNVRAKLNKIKTKFSNVTDDKIKEAKRKAAAYLRCSYTGTMSRQKFVNSINEMYIDNIITESEYIQLQERIQILTERSE